MPVAKFFRSEAGFRSAVFALGFLLAWLPLALSGPQLPAVDELFQFLEAGHRIAFGYGMVPWEFDYGARSWALGYVSALPLAVAGLFGGGPDVYLPLAWALFSLPAAGTILCAGLWGARAFGRAGGLAAALIAASWIDNLAFGGRVLSETVSAHLLIIAVYLAEPGYRVESRKRLMLAGFLAALAALLRMQLGPAALLLWLWRWRDRRRFLLLSAGATAALLLDGTFDALTVAYPFQPLWVNFRFNVLLNGAATAFASAPWWYYFNEFWTQWGLTALPFAALALLGGRRQPLLLAMIGVIVAVHVVIAHKEYRFLLPAVMMAAILCGLGVVEAAQWLRNTLTRRWGRAAGVAAMALAGLGWTGLTIANAAVLAGAWRTPLSFLDMVMEISRMPAICGIGVGNYIVYGGGGYTFLHRPVPVYYSIGDEQQDFIRLQPAYNAFVTRKDDMPFFKSLNVFDAYRLDHCNEEVCLFIRPGACAAMPAQRPPIGALSAQTANDRRYPYAVGIGRK